MKPFDQKQFEKQINQRQAAKISDVFFIERSAKGTAHFHRIKVEDIGCYSGNFISMSLSVPMYENVTKN